MQYFFTIGIAEINDELTLIKVLCILMKERTI